MQRILTENRNGRFQRGGGRRDRNEDGATLILMLVIGLFVSVLAASLLFTTNLELKTSKNQADSLEALNDLDTAVNEILWRLNLEPGAGAPPLGSQIDVNFLSSYDASLEVDPWNLLSNEADDDLDFQVDEPDELNFNRHWEARILLTPEEPNPDWEAADDEALAGPPWGAKRAEATIQDQASWREYSTDDVELSDVLTVRFKLDKDTMVGDSEGDGEEIVFYDWKLVRNGVDDKNTLSGLGGDGDPVNDSAYNITWSDGVTTYPATGSPVLLVETAARVRRAGRVVAERTLQAEVTNPIRDVLTKAICGCSFVEMGSSSMTDSYSSSEGHYGLGPKYENGDVGSNVDLRSGGVVKGDAESGGDITLADTVVHDAVAGGSIDGTPGGDSYPMMLPPPDPCDCTLDVVSMVDDSKLNNKNGSLPAQCAGPSMKIAGSTICTLDCGDYYYSSVDIKGTASIVVGDVSCGPVRIFISDYADVAGNGIANGDDPEDLQIIASVMSPNEVDLGGTSEFVGVVYAPHAYVRLRGTADYYGSILGDVVNGNGNPVVHYDEDLAELWQVQERFKLVSWLEVD